MAEFSGGEEPCACVDYLAVQTPCFDENANGICCNSGQTCSNGVCQ